MESALLMFGFGLGALLAATAALLIVRSKQPTEERDVFTKIATLKLERGHVLVCFVPQHMQQRELWARLDDEIKPIQKGLRDSLGFKVPILLFPETMSLGAVMVDPGGKPPEGAV